MSLSSTMSNRRTDRTASSSRIHHELSRAISSSFTTPPGQSFRDAFHAFARAHLRRSWNGRIRDYQPALHEPAVDALARAFDAAVEADELAPLPFSARVVAALVLTSLTTLHQQVRDGSFTPADAADLLTSTFVDGLQDTPHP